MIIKKINGTICSISNRVDMRTGDRPIRVTNLDHDTAAGIRDIRLNGRVVHPRFNIAQTKMIRIAVSVISNRYFSKDPVFFRFLKIVGNRFNNREVSFRIHLCFNAKITNNLCMYKPRSA